MLYYEMIRDDLHSSCARSGSADRGEDSGVRTVQAGVLNRGIFCRIQAGLQRVWLQTQDDYPVDRLGRASSRLRECRAGAVGGVDYVDGHRGVQSRWRND